jgi:hypothetical protein
MATAADVKTNPPEEGVNVNVLLRCRWVDGCPHVCLLA